MFPQTWTADRIKVEINSAYMNQVDDLDPIRKAEGMWVGISNSGVRIEGYSKDSDSQSSTTKSGINTQNIIIKDEAEQLKRTGKTVQEEIAAIKTDITTESAQSQSGKLENRFNKDDVQKELDFQREVTEKFGPNVAEAGSLLANKFGEEAKAKRHEAAIALEEAEKAKAENNNETNRALVKQARDNFETASREAKEWETGGSQRLLYSLINIILIKSII